MRFGLENWSLPVPRYLQERLISYALRKTLGPFIRHEISSDNLALELRAGKIVFNSLDLRTEFLNQNLGDQHFHVDRGFVDRLEIVIPWTDLRGGNIDVSIDELVFHISPQTRKSGHRKQEDLATSTADVAESFIEDEIEPSGIGDGLESEPAMYQAFLDGLLARITIAISSIKIMVHTDEEVVLRFACQNLKVSAQSESGRSCTVDKFTAALVLDQRTEATVCGSSRTTSFSSTDGPELLQSTIFDTDESRSLYMSALSPDSVFQSFVQNPPSQHQVRDRLLFQVPFVSAMLDSAASHTLDVSIFYIEVVIGREELLSVAKIVQAYSSSTNTMPSDESSTLAFKVLLRIEELDARLDPMISQSIGAQVPDSLICNLRKLRYSSSEHQGDATVSIISVHQQHITNTPVHLHLDHDSNHCNITSSSIDLCINYAHCIELSKSLSQLWPKTIRITTNTTSTLKNYQINFTVDQFSTRLIIRHSTASLTLQSLSVLYQADSTRQRLSIHHKEGKVHIQDAMFARIDDCVYDMTWQQAKPAHTRLETIDYETLFDKPERPQAAKSTIDAIREKAKNSSVVLRMSLQKICLFLGISTVANLRKLVEALPPSSPKKSPSAWQISGFLDVKALTVDLKLRSTTQLKVGSISGFTVHNLKSLTISALDLGNITIITPSARKIVHEGLHRYDTAHCSGSALRLRLRQRSCQTRIQLVLSDIAMEYFPDLDEIQDLKTFYSTLGDSQRRQEANSTNKLSLGIEIIDTSVGLNPYATKSKGYVFLRHAFLDYDQASDIRIQAGVIDLFVIDNIEGCQNDRSDHKHTKNDVVAGPLLKLGFVKILSIETVAISIPLSLSTITLSGAIITMTSCPDSTQTLISLLSLLRIPAVQEAITRYTTSLESEMDITAQITEALTEVTVPAVNMGESVLFLETDQDKVNLEAIEDCILPRSQTSSTVSIDVRLNNCFFIWNLHDGYDWERTRNEVISAIDSAVSRAQTQAQDEDDNDSTDSDEVGDLLFNSIYIALPDGAKPDDLRRTITQELAQANSETASQSTIGTVRRSSNTVELGRSRYHKARIEVSGVGVQALLFANSETLNKTSITINDFEIIDNVATSTWRKFLTRWQTSARKMANIDLVITKSNKETTAAEFVVSADVADLRLHVDQDTLDFMTRFFEFKQELSTSVLPTEELFVQRFEVLPIRLQIDYKPKRINVRSLRSGRTSEFKNFFILEDSKMTLKHVVLYGISGFPRVFSLLNDIWLAHVKSKQLSSVLAGVSPLRSIASFGGSIKKLVTIPAKEYQTSGTVLPGLQKGIVQFAKSSGREAIRLGAKLAVGTQGILEAAEGRFIDRPQRTTSLYANQPMNIKEGMSQAVEGMTRNFKTARNALIAAPQELEAGNTSSIPVALIRPLIGTTEMISKTLLGLRNSLDPEQNRLNDDKYK